VLFRHKKKKKKKKKKNLHHLHRKKKRKKWVVLRVTLSQPLNWDKINKFQ